MKNNELDELESVAQAATQGERKWYGHWRVTLPSEHESKDDHSNLGALVVNGKSLFWFGNDEQYYPTAGIEPLPQDIAFMEKITPEVVLKLINDSRKLAYEVAEGEWLKSYESKRPCGHHHSWAKCPDCTRWEAKHAEMQEELVKLQGKINDNL